MSLINDVLRDLDERRSAGAPAGGDALGGLRPAAPVGNARRFGGRATALAGAVLGGIALVSLMPWWLEPVSRETPVAPAGEPGSSEAVPSPSLPPVAAAPPGELASRQDPPASPPSVPTPSAPAARPEHAPPPQVASREPMGESPGLIEMRPRAARAARRAELRYREALAYERRGRLEAAHRGFRDALEEDPGHHGARSALAALLARRGRFSQALALVDAGLGTAPQHWPLAVLGARILVQADRIEEAVARLERSRPLLDEDPETHAFLAALYQRQGRHDEAAGLYLEVLRRDAGQGVWWMGLGISQEALGRREEALAAYRGAQRVGGLDRASLAYVRERIEKLAGASG